jgi:hypothetical protein
MKTLILAAIRCSLMFTAVTASLFSVRPAQANYIVTLEQVGSNVVANGIGAINLTGLTFHGLTDARSGVVANIGELNTGPTTRVTVDVYSGAFGPTSFGSGDVFFADTGSGDLVGIFGFAGLMIVPFNYVSGTALSDSMTFNNATLASLGVTPGTYVWTWGTGADQRFTLQIGSVGVPGVPDGSSTVSLLGFGLLGLAALRRKLSC